MSGLLLAIAAAPFALGVAALATLRRRLELVARAEHELRGPATALALLCQQLRRDPRTAKHAQVVEAQLDRLRAGLDDLAAARHSASHLQLVGRSCRVLPSSRRVLQSCLVRLPGFAGPLGLLPPRRPSRSTRSAPHDPATAPSGAPFDVRAATRSALAPWELGAPASAFAWLGPPASVRVDRGSFAKTLGNLIANAAEHGDGHVRLRGRSTADTVRIEIRNRNRTKGASRGPGPGLVADRAARLASASGRGRGLRIAAQAAREMGGRLLVEVGAEETVAVLELPRLRDGDKGVAA